MVNGHIDVPYPISISRSYLVTLITALQCGGQADAPRSKRPLDFPPTDPITQRLASEGFWGM